MFVPCFFVVLVMGKRELVALLFLPGVVMWLFLMVQCVLCGLQCVIVVFPDHTHLLFSEDYLIFIRLSGRNSQHF